MTTTTTTTTAGDRGVDVRRPLGVGLFLMLVSSATFATSGAFAASLLAVGWTSGAAVTVRVGLAAAVLAVPAVIVLRGRWPLLLRAWRPVLAYGVVSVAATQLAFFNAVSRLDVGVALMLEYLATVVVVGWLWVRHGQRPTPLTLIGTVVAVIGLALVLDVAGSTRPDTVGVLWGLAAAVGLASFFMLSANTDEQLPPLGLAWGGLTVGALTLGAAALVGVLPMAAPLVDVRFVGTQVGWWWPVLGLALVAAVVAYLTGIAGARRLGARLATFVGLTEVLFAVLFAWLLLGQLPGLVQLAGGIVILAGVALVKAGERN